MCILDECSMCNPKLMSLIHGKLCAAKKSTKLFGGMNMILIGDMHQMRPVGGKSLYQASINFASDRRLGKVADTSGAYLFTQFEKFELEKQWRCKDDEDQAERIERLREDPNPITEDLLRELKQLDLQKCSKKEQKK